MLFITRYDVSANNDWNGFGIPRLTFGLVSLFISSLLPKKVDRQSELKTYNLNSLLQRINNCFFPLLVCYTVLGLVPALVLTLRPTETIPPGTIRTTEVGSEATTEATGGPTTTVGEIEAITSVAITRTGEEVVAMATSPTGRAVVVEAGTIATMIRTTTRIAPGGGVHAHPRSAQVAAAAPATPTARLRGDLNALGAPGAPATPRVPVHRHHVIVAARASLAPRMLS